MIKENMDIPITRENGQSLVLVTLLLFVFMGMLALVLDGGTMFFNRRRAQNAADAGAMAGAREYCITGSVDAAVNRATQYVGLNQASLLGVPTVSNGVVHVETQITQPSFFAQVLNPANTDNVNAVAEAGCFCPGSGTGVLPVAWSCRPPIGGDPNPQDCGILYGPGQTYIIMDTVKTGGGPGDMGTDLYCQNPPNSGLPAGTLDCDTNNDGINDIITGGDRSWLDLSGGGGGASELTNWILHGFPGTLKIHSWVGGQKGAATSIFGAVETRVGDTVVVPVFNDYCDKSGDPRVVCPAKVHPEDIYILGGGSGAFNYHVISFSLFHITCVRKVPGDKCPAFTASGMDKNISSIEGYFVEGFDPGLGGRPGDCRNAGAWTLYLTR